MHSTTISQVTTFLYFATAAGLKSRLDGDNPEIFRSLWKCQLHLNQNIEGTVSLELSVMPLSYEIHHRKHDVKLRHKVTACSMSAQINDVHIASNTIVFRKIRLKPNNYNFERSPKRYIPKMGIYRCTNKQKGISDFKDILKRSLSI